MLTSDHPPILFHLGLPKCGSTTLQESVFGNAAGVNLWSGNNIEGSFQRNEELGDFLVDELCREQTSLLILKNRWAQIKAKRDVSAGHIVISEEMISSVGHYARVSERLSILEPNAEVLIILRPRAALLRSLYDMRPLDFWAGNKRFVKFDLWLENILNLEVPGNFVHVLEYGAMIKAFSDHLGRERVHVFTLEELSNVEGRVAKFFGTRLEISRDVLDQLMSRKPKNHAELHLAKKALRRLMGPVHASWFLSRSQIQYLTKVVGMLPWMKRTELNELQAERVRKQFSKDQDILLKWVNEDARWSTEEVGNFDRL